MNNDHLVPENAGLKHDLTQASGRWHAALREIEKLRELAYAPDGRSHRTMVFDEAAKRQAVEEENEKLRAALQACLVAMKLAEALPGVAAEYDFGPAIALAVGALSKANTGRVHEQSERQGEKQ